MLSVNSFRQAFLQLRSGSLDKIRVCVCSVEPSACDYIDMKSVEHPCSQAGERAFERLKDFPAKSSGFLSDTEKKAMELVGHFSKENGLGFETVDLANSGLATRMKFLLKGWKTPVIAFQGKTIKGLPTKEQLEMMLRE